LYRQDESEEDAVQGDHVEVTEVTRGEPSPVPVRQVCVA
jgi:hypothetical protein